MRVLADILKIVCLCLVWSAGGLFAAATPPGFTDDLAAALTRAKASGKLVHVVVTGSDWNADGQTLAKTVYADPAFAARVTNAYELVYIDTPKDARDLSPETVRRNSQVVSKYHVMQFPTGMILAPDATILLRSVLKPVTCDYYVEYLKSVSDNLPTVRRVVMPILKRARAMKDDYLKEVYDEFDRRLKTAESKGGAGLNRSELSEAVMRELAEKHLPDARKLLAEAERVGFPDQARELVNYLSARVKP